VAIAKVKQGDSSMPADPIFNVHPPMAAGSFVAVYTTLVSASDSSKGTRHAQLFKLKGGRTVVYWDVTQPPPTAHPTS